MLWIGKFMCWLGIHAWEENWYHQTRVCTNCTKKEYLDED